MDMRRRQHRRRARAPGVAIVIGIRFDGAGENFFADDVDAEILAGDILLELGGAPADISEARFMRFGKARDDRAHAADRFVDDFAMPRAEFRYRRRASGDDGFGRRKPKSPYQRQLIRF